jgi:hypothetical protein
MQKLGMMSNLRNLADQLFEKKLLQRDSSTTELSRYPVHVVYGGAHLFKANTPRKLGDLALGAIQEFAPNFAEFARAMWLPEAETLPSESESIKSLEKKLIDDENIVKSQNFPAWLAWKVYSRTIAKLQSEPVEDFRIDFEDGYGFRSDDEEDHHAFTASNELALSILSNQISPFYGFRPKAFAPETFKRAVRTLDIFLENLIERVQGRSLDRLVVTLPKIRKIQEVEILAELLRRVEERNQLQDGTLKIELMIETPEVLIDFEGKIPLRKMVEAGQGRIVAAHFGAFDYTASFGIAGIYQHLRHDVCNFARQIMQVALAPLGIRLSDSVTIEMPIPPHKGDHLSASQILENKLVVQQAWRKHFNNITFSLKNGFYQSWDLHPSQLVARYAAVYTFFLQAFNDQAARLKNFIAKATQASLTGNTFDDAASANGLLNFFRQGLICGALDEQEVIENTGLTAEDIKTLDFQQLVQKYS